MKIEIRRIDSKAVLIIRPWGDLAGGKATALGEAILEEVGRGNVHIIVDLAEIKNSDLHTLAILMECEKAARKNDSNIKLLCPPASMEKFLRDNNLVKIFGGIYADENTALESFGEQK